MIPRPNILIVTQLIGAVGLVGIVGVATFHGHRGVEHDRQPATTTEHDPLARELLRCRALSIKAKDDKACEAAWAESRRRFFELYATAGSNKDHQEP